LSALCFISFGNSTSVSNIHSGRYSLNGDKEYYLGSLTSEYSFYFVGEADNDEEIIVSILTRARTGEKVVLRSASGNAVEFSGIFPGPNEYWIGINSPRTTVIDHTYEVYRHSYWGTLIGVTLSITAIPIWLVAFEAHDSRKTSTFWPFSCNQKSDCESLQRSKSRISVRRLIGLGIPIAIFVTAFSLRFSLRDYSIMNDELGYGRYWGYLDEAKLIADQWKQGFSVENLMANFAGHPRFPRYLMAFSLLMFPHSQDIVAAQLPGQILSSLTCVLIYYIGKEFYDQRIGALAGIFLAFSPFFTNYGRTSYPYEPLALFMGLSILALYRSVTSINRNKRTFYILVSSLCAGLAFATHEFGVLLPVILAMWIGFLLIRKLYKRRCQSYLNPLFKEKRYLDVIAYLTIAFSTYVFFFPWIWPDPVARIISIYRGYARLFGIGHLIYFMGRVWRYGSPIYTHAAYIVGFTTPIELGMFIFGAIYLIKQVATLRARKEDLLMILWFGVIFGYFSFTTVSALPPHSLVFYPPLAIICGLGLARIAEAVQHSFFAMSFVKTRILRRRTKEGIHTLFISVVCVCFLSLHIASALSVYPHYEMYLSPLAGGLQGGIRIFKYGGGGIAYKKASEYLQLRSELDSVIAVGGQVHILSYYLPEYNVKALWDYPSIYSMNPGIPVITYLLSNNVKYVVLGLEWTQYNEGHSGYLTFEQLEPSFAFSDHGAELIWIYELSTESLEQYPQMLRNPGFEENLSEWEILMGNPTIVEKASSPVTRILKAYDVTEGNHRVQQYTSASIDASVFTLTGWACGRGIGGEGHPFIRIEVSYNDGTKEGKESRWRGIGPSFDWTFRSLSVNVNSTKAVEKICVIVGTWNIHGISCFDDVSLFAK